MPQGLLGTRRDPEVGSLMPRDSELMLTLHCSKHLLALNVSQPSVSGGNGFLCLLLHPSMPSSLFFHFSRDMEVKVLSTLPDYDCHGGDGELGPFIHLKINADACCDLL